MHYLGPVSKSTYGNTASIEYTYNNDPRYGISDISHKKGAVTLAAIGYPTRDNAGSPETMTDWTGEWSYNYDGHNRLTNATPPNPVPEQMGGVYGYDWVGNRLSPPTGANPMVYNNADQLISWPGMYSYSYYSDGSLEEVRNEQGTLVSSYTYHPTGLMNQAVYAGKTAVNTWDGSWRRVGLTMNGKVCSFVYDITAGIPAVIEEVIDETPVYYYREPDGELIARTDAVNSIRYYHFDALGSTRLLTKANGDITDKYAYDAWGTVVAHDRYEGSIGQPYQYVGQYGYYTHYQDSDFKLLQLGVRFYDAETGRFTSRDPMRDGLNWYGYVEGNPVVGVDPTGLLTSLEAEPEALAYAMYPELEVSGAIVADINASGAAAIGVSTPAITTFVRIIAGSTVIGFVLESILAPFTRGACGWDDPQFSQHGRGLKEDSGVRQAYNNALRGSPNLDKCDFIDAALDAAQKELKSTRNKELRRKLNKWIDALIQTGKAWNCRGSRRVDK